MAGLYDEVAYLISRTSDRVLKHWLHLKNLPYSTPGEHDLADRLAGLIRAERITLDELESIVVDIEESGRKRIYLRRLPGGQSLSPEEARASLAGAGIDLSDQKCLAIREPGDPTLAYAIIEGGELRIKYSETQVSLSLDYSSYSSEPIEVTRVVVFVVELATGLVQIRIEPPADMHSHMDATGQSKNSLYEGYYFELIESLLGVQLEPFDISRCIEALMRNRDARFRVSHDTVLTSGQAYQSYTSTDIGDVRDDPARKAAETADGANWHFERLQGYWNHQVSNGALHRDVWTFLSATDNVVKFRAQCLPSEVKYALSQVRNL